TDQRRLVEQVMSGTDQLLAACNRLMLLMRAFADDPVPSPQPFDLAGLLGDVQAIASPATPIRVAVDGDVPGTLVGDAESIRQVLTELVANALIHGRQPVGIRVETAGPGADQRLPLRFLLVEDNSINRLLTERQMARLGHRLDTLTSGRDGVTQALAGEYDVVLMDRHLPDLDGVEATQRIRAAEAAKPGRRRIPII